MSSLGFPDFQEIQQWFGAALVQAAARAVGAGTFTDGPFILSSWASVILAVKPTGGAVTVAITQTVDGAPASLTTTTSFVIPAGAVAFESVVLFGNVVSLTVTGTVPGTTVDYSLYPSNTTTNAQVITQATIGVQHNDALVASEPTLDFEDSGGFVWGIADDAAATRVKISPPAGILSGARVHNSAQIALPNGSAWTTLSFDTEDRDTDAYHNPAVNPSRMTAPAAGLYLASLNYMLNIGGAYPVGVRFLRNGATVVGRFTTNDVTDMVDFSYPVWLAAGDYLEAQAMQGSATNPLQITAVADVSAYYSIARLI